MESRDWGHPGLAGIACVASGTASMATTTGTWSPPTSTRAWLPEQHRAGDIPCCTVERALWRHLFRYNPVTRIHALMLHFQAAANRVSTPDVREKLNDALDRAETTLVEGRARVRDLRCTSEPAELSQRLLDLANTLGEGNGLQPSIAVCGDMLPLHPLVLAEALRVAEEAIRNSVRHSSATRLDLYVEYGKKSFVMRISDNGAGIPESVLQCGSRDGHYGLLGMRERARQLGGELRVTSSPDAGTDIALIVPARTAYANRRFAPLMRNRGRIHSKADAEAGPQPWLSATAAARSAASG